MSRSCKGKKRDGRKSNQPAHPTLALQKAAGVLDLMSLTFPEDDTQLRTEQDVCVTTELIRVFEGRLSSAEEKMWTTMQHNADGKPHSKGEVRLCDKFGDIFIEQTATLGWRILESTMVRAQIATWCDYDWKGTEKLRKFLAALGRYAESKRGRVRLPFTEQEWPQTRKNALVEIKALQKRLNAKQTLGNERPRVAEAAGNASKAIRTEIAKNPMTYRYLSENLLSFLDYLESQSLGSVFVARQITPGVLLNGWFDYQGCTAEDKSRQIISRIGSQRRR